MDLLERPAGQLPVTPPPRPPSSPTPIITAPLRLSLDSPHQWCHRCSPTGVGKERVLAPIRRLAVVVAVLLSVVLGMGRRVADGLRCFRVIGGKKGTSGGTKSETRSLHLMDGRFAFYFSLYCPSVMISPWVGYLKSPVTLVWHGCRHHLFFTAVIILLQLQGLR